MSRIVTPDLRRSPRYRTRSSADVTVTIDPCDGSSGSLSARLVDLSSGGAKFETDAALPLRTIVSITIVASAAEHIIELAGEVRWVVPVSGDIWYVGCEFQRPIPADVLRNLAEEGVLDRRLRRRDPISLRASAKWELDSEETPVSIVDYSAQGGFRLLAPMPAAPDSRVELLINQDGRKVVVRGRTQWQSASHEGYQVGCEFLNGHDFVRFLEVLDNEPPGKGTRIPCPRWLRRPGQPSAVSQLDPGAKRRQLLRNLLFSAVVCMVLPLGIIAFSNRSASPRIASSVPPDGQTTSRIASDRRDGGPQGFAMEIMPLPIALQRTIDPGDVDPDDAHDAGEESLTAMNQGLEFTAVEQELQQPETVNLAVPVDEELSALDPTPADGDAQESRLLHDDGAGIDHHPSDQAHFELSQFPIETVSRAAEEHDRQSAMSDFRKACSLCRSGNYEHAIRALESAIQTSPAEPEFLYILALAQFQLQRMESAELSVLEAVRLEQDSPVSNWGQKMEGYQGPARGWLEEARRRARARQPDLSAPAAMPLR